MNTPVRQTSTLAIVSLIAGILGWTLVPFFGSIAAVVCGHMARKEIRNAPDRLAGDGLAIGGLILGYATIAMAILAIIAVFLFFGGLAAFLALAHH